MTELELDTEELIRREKEEYKMYILFTKTAFVFPDHFEGVCELVPLYPTIASEEDILRWIKARLDVLKKHDSPL